MTGKLPTVEEISLRVACPVCKATPDERCFGRVDGSRTLPMTPPFRQLPPHEERYKLAKEAGQ